MEDLGKTQKDYAFYLPAISSFYVKQLEKLINEGIITKEDFINQNKIGYKDILESLDLFPSKLSMGVKVLFVSMGAVSYTHLTLPTKA